MAQRRERERNKSLPDHQRHQCKKNTLTNSDTFIAKLFVYFSLYVSHEPETKPSFFSDVPPPRHDTNYRANRKYYGYGRRESDNGKHLFHRKAVIEKSLLRTRDIEAMNKLNERKAGKKTRHLVNEEIF